MTRTAQSSPRWMLLLAALLVFMGAAHAEADGHHDEGDAASVPATAPPPSPPNNIVACFGSLTKDPLANCPSGVSSVLQSVSFGANAPTSLAPGSGGAGAGKVVFQPLTIVKKLDKTSPILLKDQEQGTHLAAVSIGFYDPAGTLVQAFAFRLVAVTSVNIANTIAPGGEAQESVGLVYGAFLEVL